MISTIVFSLRAEQILEINFTKRSQGMDQDLILVRYLPSQKAIVIGSQGKSALSKKALNSLSVLNESFNIVDFEFFRIYQGVNHQFLSFEEQQNLMTWLKNPAGGQKLQLESLSVVRSIQNGQKMELFLRPSFLMLSQLALPNVSIQSPNISKNIEIGLNNAWQLLVDGKYDQSLLGFEALLKNYSKELSGEETDKSHFGRGLSRFHQMGCSAAYEDFSKLSYNSKGQGPYYSDALYYGALCKIDRTEYLSAIESLQKLISLNDSRYEDEARFYLGVAYEQQNELSRAESAYLDTIDFSTKEALIKLSRERLELLKLKLAREKYSEKIFSVLGHVGLGWDSNVLSLPSSIQPVNAGLETGASPSYMGLLSLDAKNPWLYPLQQNFQYSYLVLGYSDSKISQTSHLQSHELGANVEWGNEIGGKHKISASWGLSLLGPFSDNEKYSTNSALKYDLSTATLDDQNNLNAMWMHSIAFQIIDISKVSSESKFEGDALDFSGNHRKKQFNGSKVVGWGASWEYKAAKGDESKFLMLGPLFLYEHEFFWGKTKWRFIEELQAKTSLYYASESSRKDLALSSSSALAHLLGSHYEARLQLLLMHNLSNQSTNYTYSRYQLNLSLSAFY